MKKNVEIKNSQSSVDSQEERRKKSQKLADLNSRPWTYMVFALFYSIVHKI